MTTGTCPYPSLHRVDFSLGTYMLPEPEGMTQVVRLDPSSTFARRFHSLRKNIMERTVMTLEGLYLTVVEPVWIAN